MTSNSGAEREKIAVTRSDGLDWARIEKAFVQCFHNAITTPTPLMMKELREATRRLAEALRDDGAQPEQALIRLKAFIRDPLERHWTPSLYAPEGRPQVEAQIYRQLFEWWLTAHFAKPTSRPRSTITQSVAVYRGAPSGSLATWSGQATADAK